MFQVAHRVLKKAIQTKDVATCSGSDGDGAGHRALVTLLNTKKPMLVKPVELNEWRKLINTGLMGTIIPISTGKYTVKDLKFEHESHQGQIYAITDKRRKEKGKKIIFHIQGGGYISCSPYLYRDMLVAIAKETDCDLYAPFYRLCPEVTMEEQKKDVLEVLLYLKRELGYEFKDIVLSGDSAGGGLAFWLLNYINQNYPEGEIFSKCGIISPCIDLRKKEDRIDKETDPLIKPYVMQLVADCVKIDDFIHGDLEINPVKRNPNTKVFVCWSATENLAADCELTIAQLKEENFDVQFEARETGAHDYIFFKFYDADYEKEFKKYCNFLKE
eukprot:augustus_masked-scaffold_2-processed-gene-11.43-mRNA-1 protein AED:0.97 eAED:1.00 QI:0/-1/0/1/-1/1/1/0/329